VCGENAYRVWFVMPMGFIRKLMFYSRVWFVAPMGFIRKLMFYS
jgi:hypothetical protein